MDHDANLCVKCETPFGGLAVDLCPTCREGRLEFVILGNMLHGADSPKMGPGRRYIVMRGEVAWHVHIGRSPVNHNGRICPFGGLHAAKEWCRDFEARLGEPDDDEETTE